MQEKTKTEYRKLAEHFYKTRLPGQQPTPKKIADALKAAAPDYRPAYWRRLRNALSFDQGEKGYSEAAVRINSVKNPVTREGSDIAIKPKQSRTRRVTEADEKKLLKYFTDQKGDGQQVVSALYIAMQTGARPAEMSGIVVVAPDKVLIPGAKKSHSGARGADRVIELPPDVVRRIGMAVNNLQGDIGPVQDKIRAAGKKLWPQRKSVPTLYSWRHQLGANLKASGMDRKDIAYVMGHQATESADRYGNPRTARGGRVLPKPDRESDLSRVRVNHDNPPAPAAAVERVEPLQPSRAGSGLTATKSFKEAIEKAQAEKGRSSKYQNDGPSFG